MGWDEISALAAIAGALVVLVGAVAAIVQLKHLRLTYQIGTYVDLMGRLNSPEMVAAREYVETCDFHDAALLEKAMREGIDHRVLMYGGFYQTIARLINHGIADRDLFAPIIMTSPDVWKKLGPLAYAWRERRPSNPRSADFEYLVFDALNRPPFDVRKYSAPFRKRIQFESAFEAWRLEAQESLAP
jgi:hypothetical protein